MTTGRVNQDMEALVRLMVVGPDRRQEFIDAVLDTGFTGELTLPQSFVAALGLNWVTQEKGVLADGSTVEYDLFAATVIWDGVPREIAVSCLDATSLLGMSLLARHLVTLHVTDGGEVTIEPLP